MIPLFVYMFRSRDEESSLSLSIAPVAPVAATVQRGRACQFSHCSFFMILLQFKTSQGDCPVLPALSSSQTSPGVLEEEELL